MLEPLMMVFMGGSIGAILIAMYLPIFTIADDHQLGRKLLWRGEERRARMATDDDASSDGRLRSKRPGCWIALTSSRLVVLTGRLVSRLSLTVSFGIAIGLDGGLGSPVSFRPSAARVLLDHRCLYRDCSSTVMVRTCILKRARSFASLRSDSTSPRRRAS